MREYEYNVFVEDVMLYTFSDYFDMTDFYDRETYHLLFTLLDYYYNSIVVAMYEKHITNAVVYKSVHALETLVACNTRIDKESFMLLCDCVNEVNEYFDIDVRIDFDEYYDVDNACIFFTEHSATDRNRHSFYDFEYCKINIDAYIRQYQLDEQIYYYDRY